MLSYSKVNLLLGCFNQDVFSDAKMNIEQLKLFYNQDAFSRENTLIQKLLKVIEQYKFKDVTESLFISVFQSDGKSDAEIQDLINKIKEYKRYSSEQTRVFRDDLKKVCHQAVIQRAKHISQDDPIKFAEEIRKYNYKSNISNNLVIKMYGDLDLTSTAKLYSGEGYKSSMQFINDSFTCGGYIPGQIVAVGGVPGSGKSLFIENEMISFINQGKRCHLMCMGDLNETDIAIRLTCMMTKTPRRMVESNIVGYYENYKHMFGDKLGLTVVPSGVVSAKEYVDMIMDNIDSFDILFIDYDANHRRPRDGSMYEDFGDIYDQYTKLSRVGKLVFVCSQLKSVYYNTEVLPLSALGQSSRKQDIIDMAVLIGKRTKSMMRMGTINIPKSRKGATTSHKWIGSSEGLFYECSEILYAKYQNQADYIGLFRYQELQNMDILEEIVEATEVE